MEKQLTLPNIPRINNFDFLRFLLAFSVFAVHCPTLIAITTIEPLGLTLGAPLGYIGGLAVRCFFVISGFLIFMSYENSKSLKEYCLKRICRIYPAYCFIIIAASFGLYFLSKFSWQNYFLNPEFFKYIFLNLLFISNGQQSLPGVFTENYDPVVNGPLWTIKIEILFYASVPILAFLFHRFNKVASISITYVISYLYFVGMIILYHKTGNIFFEKLSRQLPGQLSFFLSGALLYYYFDVFQRKSFLLFSISIAVLVAQFHLSKSGSDIIHLGLFIINFFLPISLGIIIAFIAFFTPHIHLFSKYGDLSYGIYIFHFPIVQIFNNFKLYAKFPFFASFITVAIVLGCSFLSWHLLEKRFLHRRNHYKMQTRNVESQ